MKKTTVRSSEIRDRLEPVMSEPRFRPPPRWKPARDLASQDDNQPGGDTLPLEVVTPLPESLEHAPTLSVPVLLPTFQDTLMAVEKARTHLPSVRPTNSLLKEKQEEAVQHARRQELERDAERYKLSDLLEGVKSKWGTQTGYPSRRERLPPDGVIEYISFIETSVAQGGYFHGARFSYFDVYSMFQEDGTACAVVSGRQQAVFFGIAYAPILSQEHFLKFPSPESLEAAEAIGHLPYKKAFQLYLTTNWVHTGWSDDPARPGGRQDWSLEGDVAPSIRSAPNYPLTSEGYREFLYTLAEIVLEYHPAQIQRQAEERIQTANAKPVLLDMRVAHMSCPESRSSEIRKVSLRSL
jgi:hypothetical protein